MLVKLSQFYIWVTYIKENKVQLLLNFSVESNNILHWECFTSLSEYISATDDNLSTLITILIQFSLTPLLWPKINFDIYHLKTWGEPKNCNPQTSYVVKWKYKLIPWTVPLTHKLYLSTPFCDSKCKPIVQHLKRSLCLLLLINVQFNYF